MLAVAAMITFHQLEAYELQMKQQKEIAEKESERQFEAMNKGLDQLEAAIDAI